MENSEFVAKQIIQMLGPCLKRVRESGQLRYPTAWGTKTDIGLAACIKRLINESDLRTQAKGE